jgi:hypothetical protein
MAKEKLYPLPGFLENVVTEKLFIDWLQKRAEAHSKRDKKRVEYKVTPSIIKKKLHKAVWHSKGLDYYTGAPLNWSQIGKYKNEEQKIGGLAYYKSFYDAPAMDHEFEEDGTYSVRVCSRRTNMAKSRLNHEEFLAVCREVVKHYDENFL